MTLARFSAAVVLGWTLLVAGAFAAPDTGWRLVKERNGISVYSRHTDQSRIKTFRAVMRMPVRDEYAMLAMFDHYDGYPQWQYMISSAREARRSGPDLRIIHMTTDLPWPVADRDFVAEFRVLQKLTRAEESITFQFKARPDQLPVQDGYVRVRELTGYLKAKRLAADEMEISYEAHFDPAGYIPAWIINVIAADMPYFTLLKAREYIQRPEVAGTYSPYAELRGNRPAGRQPARSFVYGYPPALEYEVLPVSEMNPGAAPTP